MCVTCLLYCCTTVTGLKPNCSLTNIYIYLFAVCNSKSFGPLCKHDNKRRRPAGKKAESSAISLAESFCRPVGVCLRTYAPNCSLDEASLTASASLCFRRTCTPRFPTRRTGEESTQAFGVPTSSYSPTRVWIHRTHWYCTMLCQRLRTDR
jgi:hypothetical protein